MQRHCGWFRRRWRSSALDAPIPGAQYSRECGNYLDHDLPAARAYARDYAEVLKDWSVEKMHYEA